MSDPCTRILSKVSYKWYIAFPTPFAVRLLPFHLLAATTTAPWEQFAESNGTRAGERFNLLASNPHRGNLR
ncbi:hypothetical protein SBA5_200030 [Candidatus Sulfotelmatomonas gaucii]|uniref:Uncharacterized protein n=1 Tax=Candidatus Sulfuritelmatomonas gaucii TaxID=2043161 RepID=A0A2N9L742_9BACT|nr:hypothetical protein SBA5_200030 [Candidatus Sulfotelmatomonas gaucii]